jgi:hypothetical protein
VFDLPPSLTRCFRDPCGRFNYRALLRTPDAQLVALARELAPHERVGLYRQLWELRPTWLQQLMAEAAGADLDRQRLRFLWILEQAETAEAALDPMPAAAGC